MKRMAKPEQARTVVDDAPWLLLVHQLPPKPAYLRVKIWRRLQGLGSIAVKNSVYVLPAGDQTREDFQWLLREIERGGGEGMICEAHLVDGLGDQQVRGLFNAARDADYAQISKELRGLAVHLKPRPGTRRKDSPDIKSQVLKLRRRFAEINGIDFFGATGRLTVEALLTDLEARPSEAPAATHEEVDVAKKASRDLMGKTWVTRRDVHIDRIACAWLIRRFIDVDARFKFVSVKDYDAEPGELCFDMFKADFTHEGDKCSFEVILERIGLKDAALRAIAEIVHDIDLKDRKFAREQAAGIAHVVAGICMTHQDDLARIERGRALLDDTYEYFKRKRGH